jgi:undecaprenyl diphosphate synthase
VSTDPGTPLALKFPKITRVPHHLGIIMDGNGRWARARGLPRVAGHRAGTENIRPVLRAATELGIGVLTIYAFSTENWSRPLEEVTGLMTILGEVIQRETPSLHANGVRIRHSGRLEGINARLQQQIQSAVELTGANRRITLNVAFNYGGRAEIVDAVRHIISDGHAAAAIDEQLISRYLYVADLPDVDLIVRTGGEYRLSNFLLWQSAYAEYYATDTYWPDFDEAELVKALEVYSQRERRFGGVADPPAKR